MFITIFEFLRILKRKDGLLKTHMVKVHEGSFPKPTEIIKFVPKMKSIYSYKRISTQFFSRVNIVEKNKFEEKRLKKDKEEQEKQAITDAIFGGPPTNIQIPILKGRSGGAASMKDGKTENGLDSSKVKKEPQQEDIPDLENDICNICICNPNQIVLEACGHTSFCQECVSRMIKKRRDKDGNPTAKLKCPFCQQKVKRVLRVRRQIFEQESTPKQETEKNKEELEQEELNEFYGDGEKEDGESGQKDTKQASGGSDWYIVERVWGDFNDLREMAMKDDVAVDQEEVEEDDDEEN